jgi:tRNA (guanine37-N1)-methyltransferase
MTKFIQTISLFPSMFEAVLNESMMFKAQNRQIVKFRHIDLRDFGVGPRKQVDDTVYGGGDGMLLKPEPLVAAIEEAKNSVGDKNTKVILMTPRGETFTQAKARQMASGSEQNLIFVCARYEGYDERVVEYIDEQISVGDYVLTGGELPAMTVIDAVVRLIPGVLGGEKSAEIESFSDGKTLEFPQYTRPAEFRGKKVPEVLLSGHHDEIKKWRSKTANKIKNKKTKL